MRILLILLGLSLLCGCAEKDQQTGYPLVYQQTFDKKETIADFEFSSPDKWGFNQESKAMQSFGRGDYQPPHRSPFIVSILKDVHVESFVLQARLRQTGREYGHRDMCLFFNYVDEAHFYYCHIATKPDNHAHNIFIVNDTARVKIATKVSSGVDWKNDWHNVRLERNVETGSIKVYFDNMQQPVLEANDTTFKKGHIGIGSFDDEGLVDDIKLFSSSSSKVNAFEFKK